MVTYLGGFDSIYSLYTDKGNVNVIIADQNSLCVSVNMKKH